MLLSEEEVKIKSQLWFAENADYLKELEGCWKGGKEGGTRERVMRGEGEDVGRMEKTERRNEWMEAREWDG